MLMRIEKQEFEEVIQKYSDVMLRCAFAYCENVADAEDVVQEAFIRYLKKSPHFREEEHRKAWLLRVVINLAKNLRRSFWQRNKSELSEDIPAGDNSLRKCEIWSAVQALPAKYKLVIELYYHEGYTIEEIAAITGSKRSTVGLRLTKAKELLKNIYEEGSV